MSYYDLLGVPPEATQEDIRAAYRTLVQLFHPDRLAHLKPESRLFAEERLKSLNRAYEVLGDPARRAAYDRIAAAGRRPSPRAAHITIPVRRLAGAGEPGGLLRMPGPPVQAGPVRVEAHPAPPAGSWGRPEDRLSVLAELALQLLARDQSRP